MSAGKLALSSDVSRSPTARAARPLAIVYVSADYPAPGDASLGGIGAHTYALAHAVAALGHDVRVITQSSAPGRRRDADVEVHMLPPPSLRLWKLGNALPLPWLRRSRAVATRLRHLARERPIDIVSFPDGYGEGFFHSFAPVAPSVVQLFGPATLVQRWDGRKVPALLARSQSYIERRPAQRAALCIAATRAFADEMIGAWRLAPERVRVVRNPLDLARFRPGPRAARPLVLFAGHLQRLKGVETLVEAIPAVLARHPAVEFVFAGNDTRTGPGGSSMREHLEATLARHGAADAVRFVDQRPQEELIALYQQCAIFVLPSTRDVYPNAVLEAMACARPVIVTSGVGVAELVTAGDGGRVVAPGEPHALASAMLELLMLPATELDRVGANARAIVERHCATAEIARQSVLAYRSIAGAAGGQPA